jgi:large subunit ribosomal protein L31
MKEKIHPKSYNIKVKCSCGNSFNVVSTRENLSTEVCYACHPFYTGKSNIVDMAGQVDKFKKRLAKSTSIKNTLQAKKKAVNAKKKEKGSKVKSPKKIKETPKAKKTEKSKTLNTNKLIKK